jgi:hypothetical protein
VTIKSLTFLFVWFHRFANLIYKADSIVYGDILDFLHSQTLQSLPSQVYASLRLLADGMENVVIVSLQAFANEFVGPKIEYVVLCLCAMAGVSLANTRLDSGSQLDS